MTQHAPDIELFDAKARFVMPTLEQISLLDDNTRRRFEAVRLAALEAEAAAADTKAAQQRVVECVSTVRTAEDRLRQLRPQISAVEAARQFIETTR